MREFSNPSDNPTLNEVMAARVSRRRLLGGGLAATVGFLGGTALRGNTPAGAVPPRRRASALLGFTAVPAGSADTVVVPDGYSVEVLIPWGQPLTSTGPAWKKDASNTAAEQAAQLGMHHDGMHFFPLFGRGAGGGSGGGRGLLVLNHEYADQVLLFADGDGTITSEKVDKALAAHGVTVVEVALFEGRWRTVDSRYNRRITGTTPMRFSGPVPAEHVALQANNPPMGTLNNCANGHTPWGTYLACEENWNGYFGTSSPFTPGPTERRYGLTAAGAGYRWHLADERFDLVKNPKEPNRFGWVVEINPFDPGARPVKRTALGRIKHENAAVVECHGRVVVYTGDDENGEYLYKFVGDDPWRRVRLRGRSPLDHGKLHVARFAADGTGSWIPLAHGQGPLTAANGWVDQADVLLRTRLAADALGATKLDRPEWVAVHPRSGDVFVTLTNGSSGPNPVNPRNPNPYGHILRIREHGADHTATTFAWEVFALAGDPAYDPRVHLDDSNIFGSPDGLWVDPDGRLWIQTDVSSASQLRADRGYDHIGNNAMLAADPATGEIRRFLVGPRGCEITGITMTPGQETLFVNVQHPGEATAALGAPTPANPRAVSNWPDHDPAGRPRAATVAIRRTGGGKIGT